MKLLFGIFLFILAASCAATVAKTPDTTADCSVSSNPVPSALPAGFPICGVLTQAGYAEISLVVPGALNDKDVRRYAIVDYEEMVPPLSSSAGWWVCVTAGAILESPADASPDSYGKLRIEEYEFDQSNGEKGME